MLYQHPLLASLTFVQQQAFVAQCRLRSLNRGEILLSIGEVSPDVFIIVSGLLRVDMPGIGGLAPVAFLGPQDVVLELFGKQTWTSQVTYVALLPTSVWRVSLPVVTQLILDNPGVAMAALNWTVGRLHMMRGELRRMTNDTSETAIGRALYRLGRGPANNRFLDRRVTQGTLAAYLGISRETVNKVMRQMEQGGTLSKSERGYEIDARLADTGFGIFDALLPALLPKDGSEADDIGFEDTVPGPLP